MYMYTLCIVSYTGSQVHIHACVMTTAWKRWMVLQSVACGSHVLPAQVVPMTFTPRLRATPLIVSSTAAWSWGFCRVFYLAKAVLPAWSQFRPACSLQWSSLGQTRGNHVSYLEAWQQYAGISFCSRWQVEGSLPSLIRAATWTVSVCPSGSLDLCLPPGCRRSIAKDCEAFPALRLLVGRNRVAF